MRIKASVAVVTGGSSGIGRAVALALARRGARVALVARDAARLQQVAGEIEAAGGAALVVPCDVASAAEVEEAFAEIERRLGPPDILVNAAGSAVWKPFLEVAVEDHRRMMDTNYWGTFHTVRAVLPGMLRRRRGSLVNISAGSGKFALAITNGFSASKFAVAGLSQSLRRELAGTGVKVSCMFPGSVRTPFWNDAAIATSRLPPIVRFAPKLSPAAAARQVCWAIRFALAERTFPLFVGFLARANALWVRLGDFLLWRWALPVVAAVVALRYLLGQ
ncbi:MAG TPA: SDR family oxidoreductase [Thermoanaerobaculia bacterium]|nr:SDR family oxidoreductase [Thermoanaerobaculia bacterium]